MQFWIDGSFARAGRWFASAVVPRRDGSQEHTWVGADAFAFAGIELAAADVWLQRDAGGRSSAISRAVAAAPSCCNGAVCAFFAFKGSAAAESCPGRRNG